LKAHSTAECLLHLLLLLQLLHHVWRHHRRLRKRLALRQRCTRLLWRWVRWRQWSL
jgi:hypothetical protein